MLHIIAADAEATTRPIIHSARWHSATSQTDTDHEPSSLQSFNSPWISCIAKNGVSVLSSWLCLLWTSKSKTPESERAREMKTKTKNCSTENTKRHLFAQELHTQPVYYVDHGATNHMPFRSFSRTESLKNKPVSCTSSKYMYAHRRNFCRCFTIQLQS
jgi:hypothetical protein